MLRKALDKNGYGFIPVISLNFAGLEADINLSLIHISVRKANKGRKVNRVHRASEGYRAKRVIPVRRAQPVLHPP